MILMGLAVVHRLSRDELAAWRRQGQVVSSAPAVPDRPSDPEPEPSNQSRLGARDTYDELRRMAWGGHQGTQATIRWLRQTVPHAVAHLTDDQLIARVDELLQQGATRTARSHGTWKPILIGGV